MFLQQLKGNYPPLWVLLPIFSLSDGKLSLRGPASALCGLSPSRVGKGLPSDLEGAGETAPAPSSCQPQTGGPREPGSYLEEVGERHSLSTPGRGVRFSSHRELRACPPPQLTKGGGGVWNLQSVISFKRRRIRTCVSLAPLH